MASIEEPLYLRGHSCSFTSQQGINRKILNSILKDSKIEVEPCDLTNGSVLEIHQFVDKEMKPLHKIIAAYIPTTKKGQEKILHIKVTRLRKTLTQMKTERKTKDKVMDFLERPFHTKPASKHSDDIPSNESSEEICVIKTLKAQLAEMEKTNSSLQVENEALSEKIEQIKNDTQAVEEKPDVMSRRTVNRQNKELEARCEALDRELLKVKKQSATRYESLRNITKRLKRREDDLKKQDQGVKKNKEGTFSELEQCKMNMSKLECENKILRQKIRNSQKKCYRLKKKATDTMANDSEKDDVINHLEGMINEHKQDLQYFEDLQSLMKNATITTFQEGRFVNEIRQTIMVLLTECNVSMTKVNQVISTVINNLTTQQIGQLPSKGILSKLLVEAKSVASHQVGESMLENTNPEELVGNVLHSDATTKHHKHYESFQVTLPSGKTMSIGLSETAGGSTNELTEAFLRTIQQLGTAISKKDDNLVSRLIASIRHTMSDQGSVNPAFNATLMELRKTALQNAVEEWEHLSTTMKEDIISMSNFFCKMHIVVNFATEADKVLKMYESNVAEGRNPHAFGSNESGTVRLIRTACKALTAHGCDKAGVHSLWKSYLGEQNKENRLVTFRGNRFNITFFDGGALYSHKDDVRNFLESLSDQNSLLESIGFDINEPAFLAGARALGIIDKIITGPYWRLLEKNGSIYDMNEHLLQMKLNMEAWSKDASPLLSGEPLFDETCVCIHKDQIYQSLMEPTTPLIDSLTQLALEVMMTSLLIILERQAKDNLPEGKHWNPSEKERSSASHIPKTNTCSERDFAMLDMLLRNKPAAGTHAFEVIIMWTKTKKAKWLADLDAGKRKTILDAARRSYPEMKQKLKERESCLKKEKLEKLKQRQAKKDDKEKRQHAQRVKLTGKLTELGGVWKSDDILTQLEACPSDKDKREALITQLQFHRDVLKSTGPRALFQQRQREHIYKMEELVENLENVLALNKSVEDEDGSTGLSYRPVAERETRMGETRTALTKKLKAERKKRRVAASQVHLQMYIEQPEKLCGKQVLQKCIEEDARDPEWYDAKVIKMKKKQGNGIKTEYIVRYEDTPEDDWCFPLLQDLKNGDLILM